MKKSLSFTSLLFLFFISVGCGAKPEEIHMSGTWGAYYVSTSCGGGSCTTTMTKNSSDPDDRGTAEFTCSDTKAGTRIARCDSGLIKVCSEAFVLNKNAFQNGDGQDLRAGAVWAPKETKKLEKANVTIDATGARSLTVVPSDNGTLSVEMKGNVDGIRYDRDERTVGITDPNADVTITAPRSMFEQIKGPEGNTRGLSE